MPLGKATRLSLMRRALLLLLLAVACPAPAAAAAARYNAAAAREAQAAYLGCFNTSALKLNLSSAATLSPATASKCAAYCRWLRQPLYAVTRAFQCACTAAVPHPSAALPDDACEALQPPLQAAAAPTAAPLFYLHGNASEGCSVASVPLSWDAFEAAYSPQNALFDASGDGLTLRMVGADGVRVVTRHAQLWGMFSFQGRISDDPGVITAAYVSRRKGSCCLLRACRMAPV